MIYRRSTDSRSRAGRGIRRCLRFLGGRAARVLSRVPGVRRFSWGLPRFLGYRDEAEATEHLLGALKHPLRRELLRRYVDTTGPLNPRDLAHLLGEPLSVVSHHVRELESDLAIVLVKDGDLPGCAADLHEASWWVRLSPEIAGAPAAQNPRPNSCGYRRGLGGARRRIRRQRRRPRSRCAGRNRRWPSA